MRDFLAFRTMITGSVIQVVFALGLIAIVIGSIGAIANDQAAAGLLILVVGVLDRRILCELLIVVFRMNSSLTAIRANTAGLAPAFPASGGTPDPGSARVEGLSPPRRLRRRWRAAPLLYPLRRPRCRRRKGGTTTRTSRPQALVGRNSMGDEMKTSIRPPAEAQLTESTAHASSASEQASSSVNALPCSQAWANSSPSSSERTVLSVSSFRFASTTPRCGRFPRRELPSKEPVGGRRRLSLRRQGFGRGARSRLRSRGDRRGRGGYGGTPLQHRDRVLEATLVMGVGRELAERPRHDAAVGLCAGAPEVVLVQVPGALDIAEVFVYARKTVCCEEGVVLVTQLVEAASAFAEELLCSCEVAFLADDLGENAPGIGRSPSVLEVGDGLRAPPRRAASLSGDRRRAQSRLRRRETLPRARPWDARHSRSRSPGGARPPPGDSS